MADPQGLDVHDIRVTPQVQFTPSGKATSVTVVTYYVGEHGPFTASYDPADGTADKIRADINHTVAELRRLTQPFM